MYDETAKSGHRIERRHDSPLSAPLLMEILRFSFHRKSHSPNNGSHFARPSAHSPFPVGRSSYSILDAPETRNAPSMSNGNPSRDADGGDDDETSQVAIGFIIACPALPSVAARSRFVGLLAHDSGVHDFNKGDSDEGPSEGGD